MSAPTHNWLKRWLLSFNDPRLAFLNALVVYGAVGSLRGSLLMSSGQHYFNFLADAFIHGHLYLRLLPPSVHDLSFFNQHYFLYWPPVPALVMMPWVQVFGVEASDVLVTLVIGAGNVAMMAWLLRAATERGVVALSDMQRSWLTVFFAFGTVHFTLAPLGRVWFTSQVVATTGVLLAYAAALTFSDWRAPLLVGIGTAAALGTRYPLLLTAIWPAWYLLTRTPKGQRSRLVRYVLIGGAPIVVACGMIGWYNFARFGSPLDYGYAYHHMAAAFRSAFTRYGAFNLHYLPTNLYYQYVYYPFPVRRGFLMGGSLFLLSPLFSAAVWSLWQDRKQASTWVLFLTIMAVNIPILLLMGTGWMQFGPRYTLDFTVPMVLLTANGARRWSARTIGVLTAVSVLQYLVGVTIFARLGMPAAGAPG
jgi:hypothetical protein